MLKIRDVEIIFLKFSGLIFFCVCLFWTFIFFPVRFRNINWTGTNCIAICRLRLELGPGTILNDEKYFA